MIHESILGLVGRTPLVRLKGPSGGAEILAKLEYMNPGGSVKDRIGLAMIEAAEKSGRLAPGGEIIEPTSGNTGVGLAIAAAVKGYKCTFVIPDKMSAEKVSLLRAFGAQVIVTPAGVGPDDPRSDISVARRLAAERGGFMPFQYDNPENPGAHYRTTGPEIWTETGGKVDILVAGMGTGGTLSGTARYLKERNPAMRAVAVDTVGSILADRRAGKEGEAKFYLVEGIGMDFVPKNVDFSLTDEIVTVSDRDAFAEARRLARGEGIFAGGSAGAAVFAARGVAARAGPGRTVVVILPDRGERYLSKFYSDGWLEGKGLA